MAVFSTRAPDALVVVPTPACCRAANNKADNTNRRRSEATTRANRSKSHPPKSPVPAIVDKTAITAQPDRSCVIRGWIQKSSVFNAPGVAFSIFSGTAGTGMIQPSFLGLGIQGGRYDQGFDAVLPREHGGLPEDLGDLLDRPLLDVAAISPSDRRREEKGDHPKESQSHGRALYTNCCILFTKSRPKVGGGSGSPLFL